MLSTQWIAEVAEQGGLDIPGFRVSTRNIFVINIGVKDL